MPILLFDIDGTLLNVCSTRMYEIVDSMLKRIGKDAAITKPKQFAGRTDRDIFYELAEPQSEQEFEFYKQEYLHTIEAMLESHHVDLFDDVHSVFTHLHEKKVPWGLLTGNFEESGKIKLDRAGFTYTSSISGFGDFHSSRADLARSVLLRYRKEEQRASDYWVIGDTPNDIHCAKSNGMTAVAVSTGSYSSQQLADHNPDMLLSSLTELIPLLHETPIRP